VACGGISYHVHPQDDVITGTLTVRENILFSAALRLSCSHEQRQEIVDNVIDELGLKSVANEKVYYKNFSCSYFILCLHI